MEGQCGSAHPFHTMRQSGRLGAMVKNTVGWLAVLLCALASAAPALAVTDADRLAVYKEFRTQFDAKQYDAAKPLAEKLVQLTTEQYGADQLQLTNPLTNL